MGNLLTIPAMLHMRPRRFYKQAENRQPDEVPSEDLESHQARRACRGGWLPRWNGRLVVVALGVVLLVALLALQRPETTPPTVRIFGRPNMSGSSGSPGAARVDTTSTVAVSESLVAQTFQSSKTSRGFTDSRYVGYAGDVAALPAPAPTSTPTPTPVPNALATPSSSNPTTDTTGGNGFGFDPKQWVIDALSAAFAWIVNGLNSAITDLLQQAFALDIVIQTPAADTYQNAVVLTFWRALIAVADSALAIIVCWAGYNSMIGPTSGVRYHEARQVLPRLALAALAINLSLLAIQIFIDLNNALCALVSGPFNQLTGLLTLDVENGAGGVASVALIILFLAFGVVGVLLIIQMVVRLAMLDVLIVTAPLGLVCWVLPQTHAWAHLWTRSFISTVFVQFVQVLALTLGGGFIAFFPSDTVFGAVMDLVVGVATLYLTLKIPGFLRSLGGPSAPNPLNDATGVAATGLMLLRFAALAAA